jgi:hypothetical protein
LIIDDHPVGACFSTGSASVASFIVNEYRSIFFGDADGINRAGIETVRDGTVIAGFLDKSSFKRIPINMEPCLVEIKLSGFDQRANRLTSPAPCAGKRVGNETLSMARVHFRKSHLHDSISRYIDQQITKYQTPFCLQLGSNKRLATCPASKGYSSRAKYLSNIDGKALSTQCRYPSFPKPICPTSEKCPSIKNNDDCQLFHIYMSFW